MPRVRRKFFTFDGRMRRRSFNKAVFGLVLLMGLAAFAGMVLLSLISRNAGLEQDDTAFRLIVAAGASLLLVTGGFGLSALVTKRARDAGLPAAPFMAAFLGAPLLDAFLIAPLTGETLGWPLDAVTPVTPIALLAGWAVLAFKPSIAIAPLHAPEDDAAGAMG